MSYGIAFVYLMGMMTFVALQLLRFGYESQDEGASRAASLSASRGARA